MMCLSQPIGLVNRQVPDNLESREIYIQCFVSLIEGASLIMSRTLSSRAL